MQTGSTRNCQTRLATNNTDNTEEDGLTVALDAANAVPQGDITHESQLAEGDALTVAPGAAGVFAKVEPNTILNSAAVASSIIH